MPSLNLPREDEDQPPGHHLDVIKVDGVDPDSTPNDEQDTERRALRCIEQRRPDTFQQRLIVDDFDGKISMGTAGELDVANLARSR